MAEGLKALPATYRFTHNQSGATFFIFILIVSRKLITSIPNYFLFLVDLDRISSGWDLLFEYHGRPSGIYAADEYLAGLAAVRG